MKISHRVIDASTPVAPKNSYQSNPPSAWQLQKRSDQLLELQQQIHTTNPNPKCRAKQLQQKLKQLERQQGLTRPKSTPNPSASGWYPPTVASPIIRPKSTFNPRASPWSPPPVSALIEPKVLRFALKPAASFLAPFPASPIIEPEVVRFAIPEPAEHIVHQEHKWGPGGLNPYTYKLLGSSLLETIHGLGNSTPSFNEFNSVDDEDASGFDIGSPVSSGAPSFIDSGYESRDSNFFRYVVLSFSRHCCFFLSPLSFLPPVLLSWISLPQISSRRFPVVEIDSVNSPVIPLLSSN